MFRVVWYHIDNNISHFLFDISDAIMDFTLFYQDSNRRWDRNEHFEYHNHLETRNDNQPAPFDNNDTSHPKCYTKHRVFVGLIDQVILKGFTVHDNVLVLNVVIIQNDVRNHN